MSCTFSILPIVSVFLLHFTHSVFLHVNNNATTIPFTEDMFPMVNSYTSINSSSIQVDWYPSPAIEGIDLTQLSGIFTIGLYVGARSHTNGALIIYPITELNKSGKIVVGQLKPDTVHSVWFQYKWQDKDSSSSILVVRVPLLMRTYMEDQTTLNDVPPFGQYKWKEITTDVGTKAIIVNASISSELPYNNRNITVEFNSEIQSQVIKPSLDFVEFKFARIDPEPKDYPLTVTFTAVDNTTTPFTNGNRKTSTSHTTVRITPRSMGNKQLLCNSFFLVFLTMLVLL